MTTKEYLKRIFTAYDLVSQMSNKNSCEVLRMRNKTVNKDIVVRISEVKTEAYGLLLDIKCPNLPVIYDVIDLDDGQIILEEYIDGITVAQAMENQRFTYSTSKPIIHSICNALSVLHQKGLVHRDIKPENVMIDSNGNAVLIDFSASRSVKNVCKDTVILGTVGYASPEQYGLTQSDARTDIYSLGILLNVMLTGNHPTQQLASGKGGRIVRKCTNINPDKRYQTAQKLANAL